MWLRLKFLIGRRDLFTSFQYDSLLLNDWRWLTPLIEKAHSKSGSQLRKGHSSFIVNELSFDIYKNVW
jgi:hypothetical protein